MMVPMVYQSPAQTYFYQKDIKLVPTKTIKNVGENCEWKQWDMDTMGIFNGDMMGI